MFDRFTERARKTMMLARQAAQERDQDFIGPGHIFIGLLSIPDGSHAEVLTRLGVDVSALRAEADRALGRGRASGANVQIPFTPAAKRVLELSLEFAQRRGEGHIGTGHLLAGVVGSGDPAVASLSKHGIDSDVISGLLDELPDAAQVPRPGAAAERTRAYVPTAAADDAPAPPKTPAPALAAFTTDARGSLDPSGTPVYAARPDETERLVQVLSRRTLPNAVLVGAPGAGKTVLVRLLAHALAGYAARSHLIGAQIRVLDVPTVLSSTRNRGDFELRVLAVFGEARRARDVIVAIDGLGQLLRAGRWDGTGLSAADVLRPLLASSGVRCIATATPEEHAAAAEADPVFARRFQVVRVGPMSREATTEVLRGMQAVLEHRHHVRYEADAIAAATVLASELVTGRCLPGSAVDVLDEAGASVPARTGDPPPHIRAELQRAEDAVRRRDAAVAASDDGAATKASRELEAVRAVVDAWHRTLAPGVVHVATVVDVVAAITGLPAAAVRDRLPAL